MRELDAKRECRAQAWPRAQADPTPRSLHRSAEPHAGQRNAGADAVADWLPPEAFPRWADALDVCAGGLCFAVLLFAFQPLALYYLTPNRARNLTLLALSLTFYSWGEHEWVDTWEARICQAKRCADNQMATTQPDGSCLPQLEHVQLLANACYCRLTERC